MQGVFLPKANKANKGHVLCQSLREFAGITVNSWQTIVARTNRFVLQCIEKKLNLLNLLRVFPQVNYQQAVDNVIHRAEISLNFTV